MLSNHFNSRFIALGASALLLATSVRADILELVNGDHYNGAVVSMSQTSVEFQSEIQGKVTLPRDKVARITLHEVAAKPAAVAKGTSSTNAAYLSRAAQSEAALAQLRRQAVDPKMVNSVRDQVQSSGSPEAVQKFDDMYGGLLSGKLSIQELRKEAQRTLTDAKAAKAELGDDVGDLLDSYMAILQTFVSEEEPAPKPAATNSSPALKPASGK